VQSLVRATPNALRSFLIIGVAALALPAEAEACGCGGTHSSLVALRGADVVFVGKVAKIDRPKPQSHVNADGSVSVAFAGGPIVTTFEISQSFLGSDSEQVVIVGNGADCDEPFEQDEVWLVYGRVVDGRVVTSKCTRTRPRVDAQSDLAYLSGLAQKKPQGIVYGEVLRRITTADGRPALQSPFEVLTVVAVRDDRRTETTAEKWGPYQLVLPPGDYQIWVERAGRPVGSRKSVHVADGTDQRLGLVVGDKN
jgi:hypothetical protein